MIVADQRMPNMTGTEFLGRVKTLYPNTVRIVLSGYTDLQTVIDAINEGSIYRFLTKPWDDQALRAAIREAFAQHERNPLCTVRDRCYSGELHAAADEAAPPARS